MNILNSLLTAINPEKILNGASRFISTIGKGIEEGKDAGKIIGEALKEGFMLRDAKDNTNLNTTKKTKEPRVINHSLGKKKQPRKPHSIVGDSHANHIIKNIGKDLIEMEVEEEIINKPKPKKTVTKRNKIRK